MEQQQLDELFERFGQQFSDIALTLAYGIRVPMGRTPMRALAASLNELDGEGRAMVAGRLARMVSDLVPMLEDAPEGAPVESLSLRQRYRQDRGLSGTAAAQRALSIVEAYDYGEQTNHFGRKLNDGFVELPNLASRNPDETYVLSAAGDDRFRDHKVRFAEGTLLGNNDLSGMTLKEAFDNVVRPAVDYQASLDGVSAPGARYDEYLYNNGYYPLWSMWAKQNHAAMTELNSHLMEPVDGTAMMMRTRRLIDPSSSSRLSPARALEDIIGRGYSLYSEKDVKNMFMDTVPLRADPRLQKAGIEEYNIYTIGTGKLDEADFWRLVPDDTDVMVVLKGTRLNKFNPQFAAKRFNAVAAERGIAEINWPLIGGSKESNAQMKKLYGKDDNYIVTQQDGRFMDYGALADDKVFQEKVEEQILKYAREGKKVCVVGGPTDCTKGDGAFRALLLGQYIETQTPFRVAHIDGGPDGHRVRVFSQEAACMKALPPRTAIENGTTRDLKFLKPVTGSKPPKVSLPLGVELRLKMLPGEAPELRTIEGHWNYGREVEFRQVEASSAHVAHAGYFYDSVRENVDYANFTAIFAAAGEGGDRNVQEITHITQGRDMKKVSLPETAEECYDPEVIDRAARTLRPALTRSLTYQYMRFGKAKVDLDNVKVFVAGSSMPRIANQRVEIKAVEDEYGENLENFHEDKPLGPSQDDTNYFVTEVMRRAFMDRNDGLEVDGEKLPFRVGEICNHYDTGVGEAAITAAQDLGIHPVVISTNNMFTEMDGDSIYGKVRRDDPYFYNRAHRGFVHDVTDAMVVEQAELVESRRQSAEDGMQIGLTDRQMLVLYELGLDNGVMLDAMDLAEKNDVSINTAEDMVAFLDQCRGYDMSIPANITAADIDAAYERVIDNEQRWRESGITYITAASALYPASMENFKEYPEMRTRPVVTRDDDGTTHVSSESYEYTVRRPAVLWCRGDLSLLQEPSVGILGGQTVNRTHVENSAVNRAMAIVKAVPDEYLRAAVVMHADGGELAYSEALRLTKTEAEARMLFSAMQEHGPVILEAVQTYPTESVVHSLELFREDMRDEQQMVADSNMDRSIVREFCSAISDQDLPVTASLDDGVSRQGILDTLAEKGHVIAVTGEAFRTDAEAAAQRLQAVGERINSLNDAVASVNVVPDDALRAALELHPDGGELSLVEAEQVSKTPADAQLLFFAMSQYGGLIREAVDKYPTDTVPKSVERLRDDAQAERHLLKSAGISETADAQDDVIRKGGLVVSDKAPDSKEAPHRSHSQRLVAGIATVAAVFDQIHHAQPMSLVAMTFYAVAGVAYVTTRPIDMVSKMIFNTREAARDREQAEKAAASIVQVSTGGPDSQSKPTPEDAGRLAADQARTEHEAMQMRRDEQSQKVSPDGTKRSLYSRVYDRLSSVYGIDFDKIFRDKKDGAAEEAEAVGEEKKVSRPLPEMAIDVLSYRGKRFFFVPDDQQHIADAVRIRFGQDVNILDPSLKYKIQESLDMGRVEGHDRFREPEGTMLLPPRSYTYKVYFYNGIVHSVNTLPSGILGLPSRPERQMAAQQWKNFMDDMRNLQRDWLQQAGLPYQAGTAQLRCENADYMVFCPNRIEVRRGDELRCFVEFKDGEVRARNLKIKDLSEYHETPSYDILTLPAANMAILPTLLPNLGDDIRAALFDRPKAEVEALNEIMADRGKRDEYENKIQNGFIVPRDDNMAIAVEDVAHAVAEGKIPDMASFEVCDTVTLYAMATRAADQAKANIRTLERQAVKIGKSLDGIEKAVEAGGMSIEEADAQRDTLEGKMEDIYVRRRKSLEEIANMEDVKAGLLEGMTPYAAGGKVVLDGVVFGMRNVKPRDEELRIAARELRLPDPTEAKTEEVKEDAPAQTEAPVQEQQPETPVETVDETPSEGEGRVQEVTEVEVVPEQPEAPAETPVDENLSPRERLAQMDEEIATTMERDPDAMESESFRALVEEREALAREVRREDIVPESEHNGICVVNTPEGQRYCNAQTMDFISEAYPKLNRMGQTLGIASDTIDGKDVIKLIRRDGKELFPMWFEKIAKASEEKILVATTPDQKKYVVNRELGAVVAGPFKAVWDFSDGRARIQREDGRYNYLDENGKLMQQSMWFDDASRFVNGRASVRIESPSETKYMIIDRDFHNKESHSVQKEQRGVQQKRPAQKPAEKENKTGITPGRPGSNH